MAQVFLRREIVDGANKFTKVIGELDELRKEFVPIVLNKGTDREVTVLLERHHSFKSELVRNKDRSTAALLRSGVLVRKGMQAIHYLTGEIVELDVELADLAPRPHEGDGEPEEMF